MYTMETFNSQNHWLSRGRVTVWTWLLETHPLVHGEKCVQFGNLLHEVVLLWFVGWAILNLWLISVFQHQSSCAEKFASSIWGPTCDGIDRVVECVRLPQLNVGDWIVWKGKWCSGVAPYRICRCFTLKFIGVEQWCSLHWWVTAVLLWLRNCEKLKIFGVVKTDRFEVCDISGAKIPKLHLFSRS